MLEQLDLFGGGKPKRSRPRSLATPPTERIGWRNFGTVEEGFEALLKRHPEVWTTFHRKALELLSAGHRRISAKGVWESVRLAHPGVTLDNTYVPIMARRLLKLDSRFQGHIELRERRRS